MLDMLLHESRPVLTDSTATENVEPSLHWVQPEIAAQPHLERARKYVLTQKFLTAKHLRYVWGTCQTWR